MFIQYLNHAIFVYIPTTISRCDHMPQFKKNVLSVVLLAHVGQLLLKISTTDMYAYCIFVESLRYKVLIFCLCGSFGGNSLLILTTLSYNLNSAIQGFFNCYLNFILLICTIIAYLLNIYFIRSCYYVCAHHLAETAYFLLILTTFPYNSNSAIQGG